MKSHKFVFTMHRAKWNLLYKTRLPEESTKCFEAKGQVLKKVAFLSGQRGRARFYRCFMTLPNSTVRSGIHLKSTVICIRLHRCAVIISVSV